MIEYICIGFFSSYYGLFCCMACYTWYKERNESIEVRYNTINNFELASNVSDIV